MVVVGLPKNMNGSEGERAEKCRNFAKELSVLLGENIPVELCDERATTLLAHTYLNLNDVKGKKRKNTEKIMRAVALGSMASFVAVT